MTYRPPKNKLIHKHWNMLFWNEYVSCKMEYRRQHGWTFTDIGFNMVFLRHLCSSCAPTLKEAEVIFLKKPWIPERPKAPVDPPKSR